MKPGSEPERAGSSEDGRGVKSAEAPSHRGSLDNGQPAADAGAAHRTYGDAVHDTFKGRTPSHFEVRTGPPVKLRI